MAERTGTWIEQRGKWLPPLRCSDCGEEIRLVVREELAAQQTAQ